MIPAIQQLVHYLQTNNHIGSDAPITAGDLARYFKISDEVSKLKCGT